MCALGISRTPVFTFIFDHLTNTSIHDRRRRLRHHALDDPGTLRGSEDVRSRYQGRDSRAGGRQAGCCERRVFLPKITVVHPLPASLERAYGMDNRA